MVTCVVLIVERGYDIDYILRFTRCSRLNMRKMLLLAVGGGGISPCGDLC